MDTRENDIALFDNHIRISIDDLPPRPQRASKSELEKVFGGFMSLRRLYKETVLGVGPSSFVDVFKLYASEQKNTGMAFYGAGRMAYKKARSIIRGW